MKFDIVTAGVGGQGVVSVSAIIAASALQEGLYVKQSEVHGMAQRGGEVVAHLRIADQPIHAVTIPLGCADLIVSMEPLESLRYLDYLSPEGTVLTCAEPVRNIPAYPDLNEVLARIRALPRARLVEASALARRAGLARATNVVMVGAASPELPIRPETIEGYIRQAFSAKGGNVVEANLEAFRAGREAVQSSRVSEG